MAEPLARVRIERPSMRRASAFLDAVRRSRALHRPWVQPPDTLERYRDFLRRFRKATHVSHLVCMPEGDLAGVINISEIVHGALCSGYLGYYAFTPHTGRGYMRAGLAAVVRLASQLRSAPARGEHPAGERALDRAGPQPGFPQGRLLAALLEDRGTLAGS